MRTKIVGIFVCMLMIATAIPAVTSVKISTINATVPSIAPTSMGLVWAERQKLLASDGGTLDEFGHSVSLDGDTVLIGAPANSDNGAWTGSAYVFTRTGTTWTQQQKLLPSDSAGDDTFGLCVSLDGDTALIGSGWDDNENGVDAGSTYVFIRTGTTWTQQAKLLASDGATKDSFGASVALSGDTALIGAVFDDDNGVDAGSAYVFTRTGITWTQQAKLLASDGAAGDQFSYYTCSLSGDTALISAPFDDDMGTDSGSTYVFTRTGITWTQQAKLLASDGSAGDVFGISFSLYDGTAIIGASYDDDKGTDSGSAYVYTRTGTTWTQQAKLLASDGAAGDHFGCFTSFSGETAIIGAFGDDDNGADSGSAYVYTRTGTTWTQQQKILASDGAAGDHFGGYGFSLDGDTAIISARYDDDNGADSGSAYVFTKRENQPPATPTITGPAKGKVGTATEYNFTATDPDGDKVYYFIDWGDTTNSSWIGPYSSGEKITQSHTWSEKGTFTIKAKAKDIYGNESDWGTLSVTMPLSYESPHFRFFEWLFERFPHAFPILRDLLGY